MHPLQDQAIAAIEPILRKAVETLTADGVPFDEAMARVRQRFEFLNRHAERITVTALCEPPTTTTARISTPVPPKAPASTTTINYNFNGANARVNHNSVDHSTNVVGDHAVIHERIADLRRSIEASDLPDSDRAEALDVVDTIDEQFSGGKPKRSVMKALLASLPKIADVAKFGTELLGLCD